MPVEQGSCDGNRAWPPERRSLLGTDSRPRIWCCQASGRPAEAVRYVTAETALKEASRLYGNLVRGRPDAGPEDQQAVAGPQPGHDGRPYIQNTKPVKAEEAQQQALQVFEKLAHEHPDVQVFAYDVGRCYQELGITADTAGQAEVVPVPMATRRSGSWMAS